MIIRKLVREHAAELCVLTLAMVVGVFLVTGAGCGDCDCSGQTAEETPEGDYRTQISGESNSTYEADVSFDGDGVLIQYVAEGEAVSVVYEVTNVYEDMK